MHELRRRRITLVLLVVSSITLLTLDFQSFGPLRAAESVVRSVVDPISSGIGNIGSPFSDGWQSLTEYDEVVAENQELRDRLGAYQGAAITSSAAEETLRGLLEEADIDYIGGAASVLGQVVDRPGNFESYAIEIDQGSDDGVRPGMPVLSSSGLVGRVTEVSDQYSQIRLLHQPEYAVGVRFVGTGEVALASGQGVGEDLEVTQGLDQNSAIEVGQAVVTSGIEGSSYPPGVVIGVVSSVSVDETQLQQSVRIRPMAKLDDLRWVTVLLWTIDGGSPP